MTEVPEIRVRSCNREEVRPEGDFVLYWMTAFRPPYVEPEPGAGKEELSVKGNP